MRNCDRAVLRVVSLSCVHSRSTAAMHKAKAKGRSSGGPAPCVWMRSNSSVQVVCKTVLEIVSPTTPTNLRVATFYFLFSATDKVECTFGTGGTEGGQPKNDFRRRKLLMYKKDPKEPIFWSGQLELAWRGPVAGGALFFTYICGYGFEPRHARPFRLRCARLHWQKL